MRMPYGSVPGLILLAIDSGEVTGTGIARWIAAETAGGYKPSVGSVYPRLESMELRGLLVVRTETGTRARHYELTRTGRATVEAERARLVERLQALRVQPA